MLALVMLVAKRTAALILLKACEEHTKATMARLLPVTEALVVKTKRDVNLVAVVVR